MTAERGFLGTGWKFPVQVTPSGRIARASDEQRIEESIYLILSTAKGERLMFAEFGCGIHELVFTPNNPGALSLVARAVRQALVASEPRIDVLDVAAESSPARPELLLIRVSYRIRSNNARGNLVYPFYITERA
jgi:phage baseplate assembly protein W